jgi:hypothetical protein
LEVMQIENNINAMKYQIEHLTNMFYNYIVAPNLDNGIPQAQASDTPCTGGDTNMAKRIKQRVKIGDSTKWATGNTIQDVIETAAKMLIDNGYCQTVKPKKDVPLLKDYLPLYQETYKKFLRKNTMAAYSHLIRNHIFPKLGSKRIDEITSADIQDLYDDMVEKGLAEETIKKTRNILKPCL